MSHRLVAAILLALLSGCASETLLLANFNAEAVGGPPAQAQPTGKVSIDAAPPGSVTIVPPVTGSNSNWARITHPDPRTPTALRGEYAQFRGLGTYGMLAAVFIPSGSGVVTLQFEPFGRPVNDYLAFLHLDFMPDNTVRVDDGKASFGTFPRDRFFTVSVRLDITNADTKATFTLFGAGASGSLDYTVQPLFQNLARQHGAVRFWMGFPHTGNFSVDDIVVNYTKP